MCSVEWSRCAKAATHMRRCPIRRLGRARWKSPSCTTPSGIVRTTAPSWAIRYFSYPRSWLGNAMLRLRRRQRGGLLFVEIILDGGDDADCFHKAAIGAKIAPCQVAGSARGAALIGGQD